MDRLKKLDQVKYLKNAANQALVHTEKEWVETLSVQVIPDASISPGKFLPDLIDFRTFKAHPTTIKAMRKDLFMVGDGFDDLAMLYICSSCHQELDQQFWHFCPYCESTFN